jgi:hypothetical protein
VPANTELIESLAAKQDAMSRRCARKIWEVLDTHILLGAAAFVWDRHRRRVRARLARFIDDAVARLKPEDPTALRAVLDAMVAEVLAELDGVAADLGPVPAACPPEEPRPVVTRSKTLAEARGQLATLQTRLMDLKARVARLPGDRP